MPLAHYFATLSGNDANNGLKWANANAKRNPQAALSLVGATTPAKIVAMSAEEWRYLNPFSAAFIGAPGSAGAAGARHKLLIDHRQEYFDSDNAYSGIGPATGVVYSQDGYLCTNVFVEWNTTASDHWEIHGLICNMINASLGNVPAVVMYNDSEITDRAFYDCIFRNDSGRIVVAKATEVEFTRCLFVISNQSLELYSPVSLPTTPNYQFNECDFIALGMGAGNSFSNVGFFLGGDVHVGMRNCRAIFPGQSASSNNAIFSGAGTNKLTLENCNFTGGQFVTGGTWQFGTCTNNILESRGTDPSVSGITYVQGPSQFMPTSMSLRDIRSMIGNGALSGVYGLDGEELRSGTIGPEQLNKMMREYPLYLNDSGFGFIDNNTGGGSGASPRTRFGGVSQ